MTIVSLDEKLKKKHREELDRRFATIDYIDRIMLRLLVERYFEELIEVSDEELCRDWKLILYKLGGE